jgi:hypothetical protein
MTMSRTCESFVAWRLSCGLVLLSAVITANDQATAPAKTKLALKAALVLTPEFCTNKMKDKAGERFEIGKAACTELEPALRGVFSSLTVVTAATASGDAEAVLTPRFVAVDRTAAMTSFSNRKMIVLLEWTVKDRSNKTVWLETVQGSASGHGGTIGRVGKNRKKVVAAAVRNAAEESASKMLSSPELRKLSGENPV